MSIFASKKVLVGGGMVLALFIGVAIGGSIVLTTNPEHSRRIGSWLKSGNPAPAGNLAVNFVKEAVLGNKNGGSNDAADENKTAGGLVKVVRVIDGDTIEIEGGEMVRYIGIDTSETVDPRKPVQCFGVEASHKNKELVDGKMARLEKDITDRDKYNRLLCYVWVGDTFINLELVKQGFAFSYTYPPDVKYQDLFIKAQEEAREAKRGLWNSCPAQTPAQTEVPALQENYSGGSCLIKGNISSSGEKIYHLPGCGSYEKTKIDEARAAKNGFAANRQLLAPAGARP